MLFGSTQTKKIPRLLLATHVSTEGVPGVQALWSDRAESTVYDLSLSGMAVSPNHHASKLKLGQSVELNLRIRGLNDHVPVKARLVKIQPQYLGFLFESMSTQGRLILDQHTKDRLIVESIREYPPAELSNYFRGDLWLHGAFDTNVILEKNRDTEALQKVLIEYENLVWIWDQGELLLQKSAGAVDENQSYFAGKEAFVPGAKVSMGASWLDRLIKVVDKMDQKRGDLRPLVQLLRSQRDH